MTYYHDIGMRRPLKVRLHHGAANLWHKIVRYVKHGDWMKPPSFEIKQFWKDGVCIDSELPKNKVIKLHHKYGENIVKWWANAGDPAFYHPEYDEACKGLLIIGQIDRWEVIDWGARDDR